MLHSEITARIIKAYYKVYNRLGYGFLERVYENALILACEDLALSVENQVRVDVYYEGCTVGVYRADLLVEKKIIVEIKAAADLCDEHEAQLINYLRATPIEVGLLLNFGKRPQYKRKLFTNDRKSGYLSAI